MEVINYLPESFFPGVVLDKENGIFEISGRACPEDPIEFYKPVFDWLDDYSEAPLEHTVFTFNMTYYNTASSKAIMMLMQRLEEIANDGNKVTVRWYYQEDDEDMMEAGNDYNEMIDVDFELIPLTA